MRTILAAAACAALFTPAAALADSFDLLGKDGGKIGAVALTASPHGLLIDLDVTAGALTPGAHGLHFHETGDCSDVGEYKKSGSHVGHGPGKHGLLNPEGPEPGDLPNLIVSGDGSAKVQLFSSLIKLDQLKDQNGGALLIHAAPDDQKSQPIGNSGARVACATIK